MSLFHSSLRKLDSQLTKENKGTVLFYHLKPTQLLTTHCSSPIFCSFNRDIIHIYQFLRGRQRRTVQLHNLMSVTETVHKNKRIHSENSQTYTYCTAKDRFSDDLRVEKRRR